MAITNNRMDPILNFRFDVQIDGLEPIGFCHVDGLSSSASLRKPELARRSKGRIQKARKPLVEVTYQNIVFRRGFDQSLELWQWYSQIIKGNIKKRDGRIIVLSEDREPLVEYQIRSAWPCRWQLSPLDALRPEILIEEVELVIKSFDIKS